ncbi:MAG TPA: hypothetical protein VN282_13810 [Pyrinomonadaceae bacterium]|nr:hypothetical protein [Pyrinomonadaceae bacterium]
MSVTRKSAAGETARDALRLPVDLGAKHVKHNRRRGLLSLMALPPESRVRLTNSESRGTRGGTGVARDSFTECAPGISCAQSLGVTLQARPLVFFALFALLAPLALFVLFVPFVLLVPFLLALFVPFAPLALFLLVPVALFTLFALCAPLPFPPNPVPPVASACHVPGSSFIKEEGLLHVPLHVSGFAGGKGGVVLEPTVQTWF